VTSPRGPRPAHLLALAVFGLGVLVLVYLTMLR
jgi:hypothetical protein